MTEQKVESRVMLIHVEHDDHGTRFWKPTGAYYRGYSVKNGDTEKAAIHVDQDNEFPVYLMFRATHHSITGIGFAETGPVTKVTGEGPCGGCFHLCGSFDGKAKRRKETPQIRNDGYNPASGYHFKLWLEGEDGVEHEIAVDPQIYNQGDTEPPTEPPPL